MAPTQFAMLAVVVLGVAATTCSCGSESSPRARGEGDVVVEPVDGTVEAIWGTDGDVFFAEHRDEATSGTIAHLRGDGWMRMPSTAQWTVAGTSRTDVWTAGRDVFHYEGASWQHPVALVGEGDGAVARGVVALGSEVWIAGDVLVAGGVRSNVWRVRLPGFELEPASVPLAGTIEGVTGTSSDDLWIFGAAGIAHRDGAGWSLSRREPGRVHAAWTRAADDVWFAGEGGRVERWDGRMLSTQALLGDGELLAISGSSAADVWVAGTRGFLAHWDGASWTRFAIGDRDVRAVFHRGDDLWLGGPAFRIRTSARALRPI
jgi:hypothetical protein